jgi:nucleoid-associated protein YejK
VKVSTKIDRKIFKFGFFDKSSKMQAILPESMEKEKYFFTISHLATPIFHFSPFTF